MRTIYLEAQITHRYVPGWTHECDKWWPIGMVKTTKPRVVQRDEDGDSEYSHCEVTFNRKVYAEAKAIWKRQRATLRKEHGRAITFTRWLCWQVAAYWIDGCRCEHDCCGHWQFSGHAHYLGKRRFSVQIRGYRNV